MPHTQFCDSSCSATTDWGKKEQPMQNLAPSLIEHNVQIDRESVSKLFRSFEPIL